MMLSIGKGSARITGPLPNNGDHGREVNTATPCVHNKQKIYTCLYFKPKYSWAKMKTETPRLRRQQDCRPTWALLWQHPRVHSQHFLVQLELFFAATGKGLIPSSFTVLTPMPSILSRSFVSSVFFRLFFGVFFPCSSNLFRGQIRSPEDPRGKAYLEYDVT